MFIGVKMLKQLSYNYNMQVVVESPIHHNTQEEPNRQISEEEESMEQIRDMCLLFFCLLIFVFIIVIIFTFL